MNRHRQSARHERRRSPLERLAQRIEDFAGREGQHTHAEIIRRMREEMFADVEALQKSGAVKLPE